MCDERKFIETIHCKEGDCLIFAVDTDIYDLEDLNDTVKDLQKKIPGIKIAIIPSDLVDNIIYINNKGGAWGILQGYTWALLSITAVLMIVCFALLLKLGKDNKVLFWSISLILFGGLGNMIDRIFRDGNVVDFLHFEFFPSFPVFM